MALILRKQLLTILLAAMVACSGEPSGPSVGSLAVTVIGLPGGSAAAVTVTGPGGYNQAVSATQTLTPLTAGTYTVSASDVTVGSTTYSGSPLTQTVSVGGSAGVSVTYTISTAGGTRLLVNINGLESSTPAALTVTGPGSYSQTVTATQTLAGLAPGTYTITAQDVTSGGTLYTASPSNQDAAVVTGSTTTATVSYSPPASGSLNLRIDGMYLTQSTQTYGGAVPLVQNRAGFLRIFVVANQANVASPSVRVRFYQDQVLQSEQTILAPGFTVPLAADESSLSNSWNVPVSGALIRPGLSIIAEVDVANGVPESVETDNAFPAAGPQTLSVRAVPTLNVTFVPIVQDNGLTGNVTNGNKDAFLESVRKMHPIATFNTIVHVPVTTTTTDTLEDDNGNGAWGTILGQLDAIRLAEGTARYYYGVVKVSYTSGVAGVAYVSTSSISARAGLGWDYLPSGSVVAAHELGHNWGRNHAPGCGVSPVDAQYTPADGSVGAYGLDVATATLKQPTLGDVMGYCDPKWIGDYTYKAVMNYLSPPPPIVMSPALSASTSNAMQPTLLVWGHIKNGEMVLEPAFQVTTRPKLPQQPGPYSIEAKAADGTTLLKVSFAPDEVADVPGNQQNFAFAVPFPPAGITRISTLRLSGRGRQAVRSATEAETSPDAGARPESVEVRRTPGGVRLRWNARAHPMVMVRDAETGEVLSLARGGNVQLSTFKREVDVMLSDGVKSRLKRVTVDQ